MVKRPSYIPDRGDIVWVSFNPQKGREQANKRPAIVVSPEVYNRKSSLALMCPITSRMKSYPFEVTIKERKIAGVALVDQIRSLDWQARKVKFIERAKPGILFKIQEKILILLTQ
jgi:mRNA interferase MazF